MQRTDVEKALWATFGNVMLIAERTADEAEMLIKSAADALLQPTAGQVALTRDEIVNLIVAKLTEIGNRDGEVEDPDPEVLTMFGEVADALQARLALLPAAPSSDALKRAVADGFTNGNEQYDAATPDQQGRYDDAATAVSALLPAGWQPTHRHVKRGSDYQVIGTASLQTTDTGVQTTALVVYRDQKGRLWARPEVEFDDGRFEPLPAPPTQADGEGS